MRKIRVCNHHLHKNRSKSLTDTGCSGIDMQLLIILNDQLHAARIRDTNTYTGIFHGTADSDWFSCCHCSIIVFLNCFQCLNKSGRFIYDLPIRKNLSRTDRITITNLPRCDANFVSHHIQESFCRKTGLCYTKSTESSCRWIVCIVRGSLNLKIFIMVRTCRMGACTFQYRTAQ